MPGQMEGRKGEWKDGQTLFHRTLPATEEDPIMLPIFVILVAVCSKDFLLCNKLI